MTTKLNLLFTILLLTLTLSHSRLTRPEPLSHSTGSYSDQLKNNKNDKGSEVYSEPIASEVHSEPIASEVYSEPIASEVHSEPIASGTLIPGEGNGGSYTGLAGGYSVAVPKPPKYSSRIVRPTVVCKEKNHCYNKKLTCPANCFKFGGHSGERYSGGGGCTMDCKKKCMAYC